MGSFHNLLFLSLYCSLLLFVPGSHGIFTKPSQLVAPVYKDSATDLHVAYIRKRTPLTKVSVLLDLNREFMWVNCETNYQSSTYKAPYCHSAQCARAKTQICHTCASPARPGCNNNTCSLIAENPITEQSALGELAQDVLAIQSIGRNSKPDPLITVSQFLFVCAPSRLSRNLPKNVEGVVGLSYAPISLPVQLSMQFGLQQKFAMCLPSSPGTNGALIFGGEPYSLLPGMDMASQLVYTPLKISPKGEYYIQVREIRIDNQPIQFNHFLLYVNHQGAGGTMISTTTPYAVVEHSIFMAITQSFGKQFPGVQQVKSVSPFGVCFDSIKTQYVQRKLKMDLVVSNATSSPPWTVSGANLMLQARPEVTCLAIVDGGSYKSGPAIVVGARQLEDNLLQFDLGTSRLGFSNSLQSRGTSCANFNFPGNP